MSVALLANMYNNKYNAIRIPAGDIMQNMTYSDFRSHLASALDQVNEDHQPLLVTRQSGRSAVVMSLEDFRSYEETAHLMSSIKNALRINEAMAQLEKGKGKRKKLIDE